MKKGKILVIDDDPNFRLLMKKILQADGHTVVEASDIQSAISLGKSEGIDLAFLDINLQNENGREFLLKRAQDSILQSFAVIMCSQDSKGEIVRNMISLGADDYLVKPIKQTTLLQKLQKHLRNKPVMRYRFENQAPVVKCKVEAEILAIGEAYCKIRGPLKMGKNFQFNLIGEPTGPLPKVKHCRVNTDARAGIGTGAYENFCTLLGISEEEAARIRRLKVSWRPE